MSYYYPYCKKIDLHVKGRISPEDARRQELTAKEILKRFVKKPGIVLADEVGMGKTFVALAVAISVALENRGKWPVVIMVPPSLKEKWPTDFELFKEKCLPTELASKLKSGRAERAVEFLKLLDDPKDRRKSVLFVTHGAMSRNLTDRWVMLALIYEAIRGRHGVQDLRKALSRVLGPLLYMKWAERNGQGIWEDLLTTHPSKWLSILDKWEIDPENDDNPDTDDDPVPKAVYTILPSINTDHIFESLNVIPRRKSSRFDQHIRSARHIILKEMRSVWQECIQQMKLRLPLLILDEAHHLKNPQTRLASLFQVPDAKDDAEEIARGALGGVFKRMLFLTATPFQLGHAELCSVLERFEGISWKEKDAPPCGKEGSERELKGLREALDKAQESAITLDSTWGLLRNDDLVVSKESYQDVDAWWQKIQVSEEITPLASQVIRCYKNTQKSMQRAEQLLKLWVIRHLKPKNLPEPYLDKRRRRRLCGESICLNCNEDNGSGISIEGQELLPFLLAARATSCAPNARPVFAEGLASSYEAFLHTRKLRLQAKKDNSGELLDIDDHYGDQDFRLTDASYWYLDKLEKLIPIDNFEKSVTHPKISATVNRVLDIWKSGEKVVVFCHYIATGKTLRQRISEAISKEIRKLGAAKLKCQYAQVPAELDRIGKRFFDEDSPVRQACDEEAKNILKSYPELREYNDELLNVVRRNVRTPSFLVRFFPLKRGRLAKKHMMKAMDRRDRSGLTLRFLLEHFFKFLVERCGKEDRRRYIEAVNRIQTGSYQGTDSASAYTPDELQGDRAELLNPTVRLVNGTTQQEQRQRLMLTFNTPFYPEILVASSVMAEGVDLHLNCRYVIHHDLCWNPTTLEQRTGRIDRIGAKVERCGEPIHIYLPYIAETQDEKMYRVVMDRERWFNVVMGEDYKIDVKTTDKLAERIPLPDSIAVALSFHLEVYREF